MPDPDTIKGSRLSLGQGLTSQEHWLHSGVPESKKGPLEATWNCVGIQGTSFSLLPLLCILRMTAEVSHSAD